MSEKYNVDLLTGYSFEIVAKTRDTPDTRNLPHCAYVYLPTGTYGSRSIEPGG